MNKKGMIRAGKAAPAAFPARIIPYFIFIGLFADRLIIERAQQAAGSEAICSMCYA